MSLFDIAVGAYKAYEDRQALKQAQAEQARLNERAAEMSQFTPYGVTTGLGTSFFDTEAKTAGYELDPRMAAYRDQLYNLGAQALPTSFDPQAAAQTYYDEMQTMMAPARAQQATQLQQDIFGSGRLGLQLAGEAAGAGRGTGMYQPDVLGFNQANAMQDQQLAIAARDKAMAELDQAINRGTGLMRTGIGVEELGADIMTRGAALGGQQMQGGANAGGMLLAKDPSPTVGYGYQASQVIPDYLMGTVS